MVPVLLFVTAGSLVPIARSGSVVDPKVLPLGVP